MFKSPSEKRIFSYYLKSPDYTVLDLGKRLRRVSFEVDLPLALVEKRLTSEKLLLRVNKMAKRDVCIGCGSLKEMEKSEFNNCYNKGFFLHCNGFVIS
jgi:hypothetical protein